MSESKEAGRKTFAERIKNPPRLPEMVRAPITHNLKINRAPYDDLVSGAKTSEVRNCSDRDFRVGDRVELFMTETADGFATESIVRKISHIQRGYGLPDGLCVLSYESALRQQLADVSNERDGLRAKLECSQGDMRQADQVMERQRTQISDLEQSLEDSPHALASALCQKLATMRGGPIDWAEAIAITAIVTRLSPEEEARLLAFDAVAPATDEQVA